MDLFRYKTKKSLSNSTKAFYSEKYKELRHLEYDSILIDENEQCHYSIKEARWSGTVDEDMGHLLHSFYETYVEEKLPDTPENRELFIKHRNSMMYDRSFKGF